ncbi:MAG: ATP-binding protein, partial [Steroidobacteraceae bacterium]
HNLVANALKYTDAGRVCVRCEHAGSHLSIDVEDTGIGIPQEQLPTIFNEFYQLEHHGHRRQGIGLGLAIVRHICNLLDYQVEVTSEVGHGTRFRVHIPLDAYLPPQALQQKREVAKPGEVDLGRPPRILVIEDDDSVREALVLALEMEDFDPVAAASAEQALQQIQESSIPPDLVVSDYHLGAGMTGVDVVTQLRHVSGAALPAVFLSGDTSSAMRSVREFPRSELLRKPVDLRQLANAARELLANKAGK